MCYTTRKQLTQEDVERVDRCTCTCRLYSNSARESAKLFVNQGTVHLRNLVIEKFWGGGKGGVLQIGPCWQSGVSGGSVSYAPACVRMIVFVRWCRCRRRFP